MKLITKNKINIDKLYKQLEDPSCGGVVCFEGRVRDHHENKKVTRLVYECYEPMAIKVLETICKETKHKWPIKKISLQHRIGAIPIGQIAIWIGVASHHRGEAFAACQYLINEIKKRVPIWKRETYQDGTEIWVECTHE